MNSLERIERMDRHLAEHPHDYQTVISRMKAVSDAIEHKQNAEKNRRLARLAAIRRQRRTRTNGTEQR